MPSFSFSHDYTLFINRQLLYYSSTKTVGKIYLAKFKALGTTGLAL